MEIENTPLRDCVIIKVPVYGDDRGFFLESFHFKKLSEFGIHFDVKQINFAKSQKNVLRGLHYQQDGFAQAKVVGVINGSVLDVVLDIRPNSPTYLQHFKLTIQDPGTFLFVPRGFAHGYKTLEDDTIFYYAVDNYYSPENEGGIRFNDPNLRVDWELEDDPIISVKDLEQPFLKIR